MSDNTYLSKGADQYLAKEFTALKRLNEAWKDFTSSISALNLQSVVEFDELTNSWKVLSPVKLPAGTTCKGLKADPWGQPGITGQSTYKLKVPSILISKATDLDDEGMPKQVIRTRLASANEVVNADPNTDEDEDDEESAIDYAFIVKDTNEIMKNAYLHNERTQKLVTYTNFIPNREKGAKGRPRPLNEIESFRTVLMELLKQSREKKDDIKVQRILEGLVLRLQTLKVENFNIPKDISELTSDTVNGTVNLQWLIEGYSKVEEVSIEQWGILDTVFKYYWSHHSPEKFYDGLYSFWRSNYPKTFAGRVASYFEDKSGPKRHLGKNKQPERSKESKKAGGTKTEKKGKEKENSKKKGPKQRSRSQSRQRRGSRKN
jgi:hypothetical protein